MRVWKKFILKEKSNLNILKDCKEMKSEETKKMDDIKIFSKEQKKVKE